MKGKICLIPVKEPKEGMKVVLHKTSIETIDYIGNEEYNESQIYLRGFDGEDWFELSELQQIAVEYEERKKTLPLYPDDYETALPIIGKEVDIEPDRQLPHQYAKLIAPTPVMYTEEEVRLILDKTMDLLLEGEFNPSKGWWDNFKNNWWDKNKKK